MNLKCMNIINNMLNNLDLFSGMGGFSYVMHKKIKTIGYCDTSKHSKNVLSSLISKQIIDDAPIFNDVLDINSSSFIDKPKPDMITGGFPCQDISSANKTGKGLDGKRSSLFYEIIRICDEIPSVQHVFLENVGRIVTNDIINVIKKTFTERGFDFKYVVLTAKQFGAPHTRRRCFMIATKNFAVLKEGKVPFALTGTAVGIISVVGYIPDIFAGPIIGYLLDENSGIVGHQYVYLMLVFFSLIGLMASIRFAIKTNRVN